MALVFQRMLEQFGLTEKIHTVNANNTMANDKQTTKLDSLNNSFEAANHVQCFNHTFQLSMKVLLAPFNPAISCKATQDDSEDDGEEDVEEDVDEKDDDEDDEISELGELSEDEWAQVLEDTAGVHETVIKVCCHKADVHSL